MFKPTKVIDKRTPSRTKMNEETNQNIQVFVRCRPLNSHEKKGSIDIIPEKRSIRTIQHNKSYSFDNVFDDKAKQIDVYRSVVEPLVEQVIEGYNCTVFAYGQTGTGKTYTMVGNRSEPEISWEDDPLSGIIPRAIDQLIDELQHQNTEYTIRVSFLELYNEDAYDLLSALSDTSKLRIYNDSERKGSVIISGLVEMIVQTKAEIFEILEKGSLKRQTAPTLMNACSSRSHSIFSITVHIKETTFDGEEVVKMGKLNLVDLAGSENIGRSGAVEERFREASNINKSLLTLGRVITSLVEKSSHIPYRDSKLTRLLQDSLGGKTKTSIIATISPCVDDIEDTVSTLDYAQRAKKITNKPEINLKMSKKTLLHEYLNEIERLRRDLEATRDKKGIFVDAKNYAHMEATIKSQEQDLELKEAQIENMKQELDKYSILLSETNEDLSNKRQELNETKEKLEELSNYLAKTKEILEKTQNEVEDCKVVIDVHKKNEEKLLKKAETVLTVADKCVDDNKKLFNKLDSFTSLEDFNADSLQKFKDNSIKQMKNIISFNTIIQSELVENRKSFENFIGNDKAKIQNKNSELKTSIDKIKNDIENFSFVLIESLKKNDNCDEKNNIDIYSLINIFKNIISNELNQFSNTLKENAEEQNAILDELSQESVKNYSILEESIMSQSSKINDFTRNLTFMVQSCEDFSKQTYNQKTEKLGELNQEILKTKEAFNKLDISQKLETMETELEKLKDLENRLSQSLIGIKAEYEEKVLQFSDVAMKSFQNRVHSMLDNESENRNETSFKFKELICSINKYEKENLKYLSELDKQNNINCESAVQKYDQIKKIHKRLETFLTQFKSKNDTQIDEWFSKIDEKINSIIETTTNATVETSIQIESNHLIADEISKQIHETLDETLEKYNKIESECKTLCESQKFQLNEFLKMIQKLETNYKKYQSSGCTPKRQEFFYPKTFTPTSPHERIISRFRQHIQNGISNNDFENISSSFNENSIDIFGENVENQIEKPSVADATIEIRKIDSSATTAETNRTFLCKKRFLKEKN